MTLTTSKSTSNLRANLNLKPDTKPPSSSVSTSVAGRPNGHTRTASSSTVNSTTVAQSRNLATTLTRVSRKEPVVAAPVPYVPVRPVQASRTASEPAKTEGKRPVATSRTTSNQDSKRSAPILRTQPSMHSRTVSTTVLTASSSTAPRRLQLDAEIKAPISAITQASASGPRRVPIPAPPPPAPKKEQDGPKRTIPKVDNASSTSRPAVHPPPPMKKSATVTLAKERRPPVKPPIPKYKPISNPAPAVPVTGSSSTAPTTRPLIIAKAKPSWGRPAAAAKSSSSSSQKLPMKSVVKKPSSLMPKPAGTSEKRPVTPAMVALPPSPTPTDEVMRDDGTKQHTPISSKEEKNIIEDVPEAGLSNPELEVSGIDEDSEQTIQNHTQNTSSPIDTCVSTPTNEGIENKAHDDSEEVLLNQELRLPTSNGDLPRTPQNNLLPPSTANTTGLAAKTPISALLSSIERGFLYSPTTPLSPADSYLPGPNGVITYSHETHAPRVEGPMQAFNHALHANPKGGFFGSKFGIGPSPREELKCGDIGVVDVSEHNKLYSVPSGLPSLDDGTRLAFVEINK